MSLQYITNNAGALKSVVVPIEYWERVVGHANPSLPDDSLFVSKNMQGSSRYSQNLISTHILVPNTHTADFIAECKKQTSSLHNDPQEKDVLDWIEAVSCQEGWK